MPASPSPQDEKQRVTLRNLVTSLQRGVDVAVLRSQAIVVGCDVVSAGLTAGIKAINVLTEALEAKELGNYRTELDNLNQKRMLLDRYQGEFLTAIASGDEPDAKIVYNARSSLIDVDINYQAAKATFKRAEEALKHYAENQTQDIRASDLLKQKEKVGLTQSSIRFHVDSANNDFLKNHSILGRFLKTVAWLVSWPFPALASTMLLLTDQEVDFDKILRAMADANNSEQIRMAMPESIRERIVRTMGQGQVARQAEIQAFSQNAATGITVPSSSERPLNIPQPRSEQYQDARQAK